MAVEIFANQPSTTVTTGGTTAPAAGTVQNWTVASSATFPAASSSGPPPTQFHVADALAAASSELILVTNVSGTTWTVTRGAEGTAPVAHAAGFTILQVVTAGALTQLRTTDFLNAVTMFGADNTASTDSTTAFGNAVSAAHGAGVPLYIPAGSYEVSSALNWKLAGLQVYGAGSAITSIKQTTANTPILQVAGQGQHISGLELTYTGQQGATATSANNIQFGDDTVGSCFLSTFEDLYCQLGYTALTVNPALVTSAGLFSSYFRNIHVLGYYQHAIGLAGNAGGGMSNCTGCQFDNVYIHNNEGGTSNPANSYPLFLESWDEIVFNQLNIEHGESFILDLIGLSGVGNCVINSLHIEAMQLSGSSGNASYFDLNNSGAVVNGMSVRFGTMTGTTSNAVARFSGSGPSAITITGFNEGSENTFSHAHPYADFGSIANCTMAVSNVVASQTTTDTLNATTGDYFQLTPPQDYTGTFGDGSDGAATLDGTATVAWATKSGSTYTMSRDCFTTTLTINSGVTLKPSGSRIFCQGTVSNAGSIVADGNPGTAAAGGASSGSAVNVGGRPGGTPAVGAGGAGTAATAGLPAAGAGGTGSGGAGGAGGTTLTTGTFYFRNPVAALSAIVTVSASNVLTGGAGGGSGGGDGSNKGGGGGGGGGPIVIFAQAMSSSGALSSAGGAGFTPAAGNCGGGGGGTGGLILIYTLSAWTNTGTTAVTAGGHGSGIGSGTAGTSGGTGVLMNVVLT